MFASSCGVFIDADQSRANIAPLTECVAFIIASYKHITPDGVIIAIGDLISNYESRPGTLSGFLLILSRLNVSMDATDVDYEDYHEESERYAYAQSAAPRQGYQEALDRTAGSKRNGRGEGARRNTHFTFKLIERTNGNHSRNGAPSVYRFRHNPR